MKDSNEQVKRDRDLDPVIEAYKKHIDVNAGGTNLSIRAEVRTPKYGYNFQLPNFRTRALLRDGFKNEPSNLHGLHAATEAL